MTADTIRFMIADTTVAIFHYTSRLRKGFSLESVTRGTAKLSVETTRNGSKMDRT